MTEKLVEIQNLSVHFKIGRRDTLYAVQDMTVDIFKGETLGLVGESGSGKTTAGRVIKNIIKPTAGRVLFEGRDIHTMKGAEKKAYTKRAQMIFQDPYSSLDPRMTVREIVKEGMRAHRMHTEEEMNRKALEFIEMVGLTKEQARRFPHEFSAGQRQRIGIARAMAVNPEFVVCDEPTSALDVSIQAQIITLLKDLQKLLGLTYLFISHDLSVVKYVSDRVAVMYLGEIVEIAPSRHLFASPRHPYTISLISSIQIPDPRIERSRSKIRLRGDMHSAINLAREGCKFTPRCPYVHSECGTLTTSLVPIAEDHFCACPFVRAE
ncbi:MAG: ABC transporter ATP-binding protein [Treponema sp.]|jgi:oligopeptide transport system ATP-binding protein|nr:ABC transporter ATP-binding protein [Treponema sp.]